MRVRSIRVFTVSKSKFTYWLKFNMISSHSAFRGFCSWFNASLFCRIRIIFSASELTIAVKSFVLQAELTTLSTDKDRGNNVRSITIPVEAQVQASYDM